MRMYRINILAASVALIMAAGAASADDAPAAAAAAPAKPVLPSVADLLDASGISATGYVSGTFDYQGFSGSNAQYPAQNPGYSTFTLQQAAFTLSKLPMSGLGALVNVLAGQNIYTPNYAASEGVQRRRVRHHFDAVPDRAGLSAVYRRPAPPSSPASTRP